METNYAEEFTDRCNQLVRDHKSVDVILSISAYEFAKFIRTVSKTDDSISYIFIDDTISRKEKRTWTIIK